MVANYVKVAQTTDLAPGTGKVVEVNGSQIALFNVNGTFYAIDNICVHRGGPLGEGFLDGEIVTCPWHGWRYNVTTGVSPVNPAVKVKTYKVVVEGQDVKVATD